MYSFLEATPYSDYVQEVLGGKDFYILYYEIYEQLYCVIIPMSYESGSNLWKLIGLKKEPLNGWLDYDFFIQKQELFSCFPEERIYCKRVEGKNIIRINGTN